jgi:drug/metabolite transporter (DMT)-like permease
MSFILALISATSFGVADFFGGIAARRMWWLKVIGLSQASAVVVALISLIGFPPTTVAPLDYIYSAAAGVCLITGVGLLYRALAEGQMSVVAPVTALTAIGLPVLYGFAIGEHLGWIPVGGILLAVVAVILLGRGEEEKPASPAARPSFPPLLVALIAGAAIGIEYIALDATTPESGLVPPLVARATCGALVAVIILAMRKRGTPDTQPGGWRSALVAGVFDATALSLYVLAVRGDSLPLIATISSLYPAATIALAFIVMGERPNRPQKFGLALALIAVLALANG